MSEQELLLKDMDLIEKTSNNQDSETHRVGMMDFETTRDSYNRALITATSEQREKLIKHLTGKGFLTPQVEDQIRETVLLPALDYLIFRGNAPRMMTYDLDDVDNDNRYSPEDLITGHVDQDIIDAFNTLYSDGQGIKTHEVTFLRTEGEKKRVLSRKINMTLREYCDSKLRMAVTKYPSNHKPITSSVELPKQESICQFGKIFKGPIWQPNEEDFNKAKNKLITEYLKDGMTDAVRDKITKSMDIYELDHVLYSYFASDLIIVEKHNHDSGVEYDLSLNPLYVKAVRTIIGDDNAKVLLVNGYSLSKEVFALDGTGEIKGMKESDLCKFEPFIVISNSDGTTTESPRRYFPKPPNCLDENGFVPLIADEDARIQIDKNTEDPQLRSIKKNVLNFLFKEIGTNISETVLKHVAYAANQEDLFKKSAAAIEILRTGPGKELDGKPTVKIGPDARLVALGRLIYGKADKFKINLSGDKMLLVPGGSMEISLDGFCAPGGGAEIQVTTPDNRQVYLKVSEEELKGDCEQQKNPNIAPDSTEVWSPEGIIQLKEEESNSVPQNPKSSGNTVKDIVGKHIDVPGAI